MAGPIASYDDLSCLDISDSLRQAMLHQVRANSCIRSHNELAAEYEQKRLRLIDARSISYPTFSAQYWRANMQEKLLKQDRDRLHDLQAEIKRERTGFEHWKAVHEAEQAKAKAAERPVVKQDDHKSMPKVRKPSMKQADDAQHDRMVALPDVLKVEAALARLGMI